MKKIVLLAALVICTFAASAQNTVATTSDQLAKSKTSGTYVFNLPADVTSEKVDKLKSYYVQYFTTTFDEKTHKVSFVMVANEPLNRKVMQRFMSGAGVNAMKVDDSEMPVDVAFDKFIQ